MSQALPIRAGILTEDKTQVTPHLFTARKALWSPHDQHESCRKRAHARDDSSIARRVFLGFFFHRRGQLLDGRVQPVHQLQQILRRLLAQGASKNDFNCFRPGSLHSARPRSLLRLWEPTLSCNQLRGKPHKCARLVLTSFHQIVVWHDEQVARESALRRKPGLTLAFGSGQTYFVAQTGAR